MATYKDDLDIIKAAEKDSSKLSLNAITELDNKGLLGMYNGGDESGLVKTGTVTIINDSSQDVIDVSYIKQNAIVQGDPYYIADYVVRFTNTAERQKEIDFVYPSMVRITSDPQNLIFNESQHDYVVVREDNMVLHIVDGHGGK